jgi:hypothetical protein
MLRKILNFGVALLDTVCDLYKIVQLVWDHIMHVINFLRT